MNTAILQNKARAAHNGFTKHIFRYKVGDYELGYVFDDECVVFHNAPMTEVELEDYWNQIAEFNAQFFIRGTVDIVYPFCYLESDRRKNFFF